MVDSVERIEPTGNTTPALPEQNQPATNNHKPNTTPPQKAVSGQAELEKGIYRHYGILGKERDLLDKDHRALQTARTELEQEKEKFATDVDKHKDDIKKVEKFNSPKSKILRWADRVISIGALVIGLATYYFPDEIKDTANTPNRDKPEKVALNKMSASIPTKGKMEDSPYLSCAKGMYAKTIDDVISKNPIDTDVDLIKKFNTTVGQEIEKNCADQRGKVSEKDAQLMHQAIAQTAQEFGKR